MLSSKTRLLVPSFLVAAAIAGCDPEDTDSDDPIDTDTEPVATFELSLYGDKVPVLHGTSATIEVTVTRSGGFAEAVTITAADLPEGVTAEPVTVAAGEDSATIEIRAAATAPHSLPTDVAIVGTAGDLEAEEPLTVTVTGMPGAVDTSFAGGGRAVMEAGRADDYGYAVAVQADGKILVAGTSGENGGDFALFRLDRDGLPDASFGDAGLVTVDVGSGDVAYAVAAQADGRILVAGVTNGATGRDFALLRFDTDGSPDEGFGTDGVVTTSFTADSDAAYAIALQADGKIVLGGEASMGSSTTGVDFALARYEADGSLDEGFGDGGKVLTALSSYSGRDTIYALAIDAEDRIVAAGGEGDFVVARYLGDGSLDAAFSEDGKLVGILGSTIGAARGVQVDGEGRIVIAGHRHHDFTVARLDEDGALDAEFGDDGITITPVSATNWDEARGLALEEDGGIVLAGWSYEGNSSAGEFAVVRYDQDGSPDPSFGTAGVVITPGLAPSRRDEATGLVLQADERVPTVRIVAAGSAAGASNSDLSVVRYWR
jgi:uncharacterized delta-60 repeat protein